MEMQAKGLRVDLDGAEWRKSNRSGPYSDNCVEVAFVGDTVVQDSRHRLPSPPSLQLYQTTFALVGDNSYYGFTSPVRGHRYRLEGQPTIGDLRFTAVTADYRRYFFFRPVTVAARTGVAAKAAASTRAVVTR